VEAVEVLPLERQVQLPHRNQNRPDWGDLENLNVVVALQVSNILIQNHPQNQKNLQDPQETQVQQRRAMVAHLLRKVDFLVLETA
jgi:hypothetical protein